MTITYLHIQYICISILEVYKFYKICVYLYEKHPKGYEVGFVALVCISLMINDIEHLLSAHWPVIYFLWRNIYSSCMLILS